MPKDKKKPSANSLTKMSKRNKEVLDQVTKAKQKYIYEYGPLTKSEADKKEAGKRNARTDQYEQIIHELIEDIYTGKNNVRISLENGELHYSRDSGQDQEGNLLPEKGNLTELIKKANKTHLELSDNDLETYASDNKFHNVKSVNNLRGGYEIKNISDDKIDHPSPEKFQERINNAEREQREDVQRIEGKIKKNPNDIELEKGLKAAIDEQEAISSLRDLSHGEKIAIYKHTTDNYAHINYLSREQYDKFLDKEGQLNEEAVKKYLIDGAVTSNAINKIRAVNTPTVTRYKDDYGRDQMIEDVNNNKVTQESSFLSTAYAPAEVFAMTLKAEGKSVDKVIIEKVKGVNISPLSKLPGEKEYLIPPSTQLKWTGHKIDKDGSHIFTAEGANVQMDRRHNIKYDRFKKNAKIAAKGASVILPGAAVIGAVAVQAVKLSTSKSKRDQAIDKAKALGASISSKISNISSKAKQAIKRKSQNISTNAGLGFKRKSKNNDRGIH